MSEAPATVRSRALGLALVASGILGVPGSARGGEPDPAASTGRYANDLGPDQALDNAAWWQRFGDGELNALVDEALHGNFDVAIARNRAEEAEAVVVQQLAPLLPQVAWVSSLEAGPSNTLGFLFGRIQEDPNIPYLYLRASSALNLAVDLDVTGRGVLAHRAAKGERRAAEHDVEAQKLVLAAAVTRTYFDAVAAQAQLAIVKQQIDTNAKLLELTEMRLEAGQASTVEVLQQRQLLAQSKTLLPLAEQQKATFEQRLAVLLGEPPGRSFALPSTLPELPPQPGLGTPEDLAQHRPDLRALDRRKDAARERTRSARRQFAPGLRVTGLGGVQAIRIEEWRSQGYWTAGAALTVPLTTGGATIGRLQQRKAEERRAENAKSAATLEARLQVENALMREQQQEAALALQREQAAAARAAFEESRSRYAAGLSEYLTVLTAWNAVQRAELDVVTAHRDLVAARIDLHAALGDR